MKWLWNECGWTSEQFKNEAQLQNAIELIISTSKFGYSRDRKVRGRFTRCKSRPDFVACDKSRSALFYIEAKVETKSSSFDRALGQALRNAICDHSITWIVIPDDVHVKEEHVRCIYAIGGEIVRISDLSEKLRSATGLNRDFKCLDQHRASSAATQNRDALEPRKIAKAIEKRFRGVTRERRNQNEEANRFAVDFLTSLVNNAVGREIVKPRGLEVA